MPPVSRSQNEAHEIHRGKKDDRWRHHLSPIPQFSHGTEGEKNILQSPALMVQPKRLSDPLIYQARSPCVFGGYLVASGIEPRQSGLESDALTTRLPTVAYFYMEP
ncbi:hypothetical protein TNCV_4243051 [Trichonephila clavipes]|nr:hypothetical protein TNCV_4243051 [Trichonephila clavipes]